MAEQALTISLHALLKRHVPAGQWRSAYEHGYVHRTTLQAVVDDYERVRNELLCLPGVSSITLAKIRLALVAELEALDGCSDFPGVNERIRSTREELESRSSKIAVTGTFTRRSRRSLLSQLAESVLGTHGKQPVTIFSRRIPDAIKTKKLAELEYGITVDYDSPRDRLQMFYQSIGSGKGGILIFLDSDELTALRERQGIYAGMTEEETGEQMMRLSRLGAVQLPGLDFRVVCFREVQAASGIIVHGKEAHIEFPGGILRLPRGLMLEEVENLCARATRASERLGDVMARFGAMA